MDSSIIIPCTLVPVKKHNLLIPNSAIAEVIISDKLEAPDNAPKWLPGLVKWQDQDIFVIEFDAIDSDAISANNNKNTVLVIRNLIENDPIEKHSEEHSPTHTPTNNQIMYFGILAKSVPQIVEANSHSIDRNLHPKFNHSLARSYININGIEAIIPNIASLAHIIENANLS